MDKYRPYFTFLLLVLLMGGGISSCNDDFHYSTDPNHQLRFSTDTVFFDTVFTTIGTSTHVFKIHNRNSEHLNIASVKLGNQQSCFRINVDGHSGTEFHDLEIRKKDSMYVFVDVFIDPTNRDNPIFMKDSIVFQLSNGVKQDVKLLAYGQDVLKLRGKVIDKDTVFTSWRPILVYDSLRVEENVTLTFSQGTRLYFHSKADCLVHGTLRAEGTIAEPVLLRGDRLDWIFSDLSYDQLAGQWGGVRFYETSYDNYLNYVDIHGGDSGIKCDSSDVDRMKLFLENSVIHNMRYDCLNIVASKVLVGNSQITNAGRNCVYLLGGNTEFIHCTIAGFHLYNIMRNGDAVAIYNEEDKPMLGAVFRNCLITGSKKDELIGTGVESDPPTAFNYLFYYSLVNTILDEEDEGYEEQIRHYVNVKWDDKKDEYGRSLAQDKNFLYIGSDYLFDFRPDSLSAAIDMGNFEDAIWYPLDRQGRSRLADGAPDVGCYEWMPGDGKKD